MPTSSTFRRVPAAKIVPKIPRFSSVSKPELPITRTKKNTRGETMLISSTKMSRVPVTTALANVPHIPPPEDTCPTLVPLDYPNLSDTPLQDLIRSPAPLQGPVPTPIPVQDPILTLSPLQDPVPILTHLQDRSPTRKALLYPLPPPASSVSQPPTSDFPLNPLPSAPHARRNTRTPLPFIRPREPTQVPSPDSISMPVNSQDPANSFILQHPPEIEELPDDDEDSARPFLCMRCDFRATNNWTLSSHVERKHEMDYQCPKCPKLLSDLSSAKGHLIKKHKFVKSQLPDYFERKWNPQKPEHQIHFSQQEDTLFDEARGAFVKQVVRKSPEIKSNVVQTAKGHAMSTTCVETPSTCNISSIGTHMDIFSKTNALLYLIVLQLFIISLIVIAIFVKMFVP